MARLTLGDVRGLLYPTEWKHQTFNLSDGRVPPDPICWRLVQVNSGVNQTPVSDRTTEPRPEGKAGS